MDGVAGKRACPSYPDALTMFKTQASKTIKKYRDMMGKYDIIDVIEPVIDDLAIFFGVSRLAAKIRMVDAGYKEVRGAFIYVDGRYVTSHRYKKDSITEDQTFSILQRLLSE